MYQSNKKQMGDEQTQADYIICYLKKSMGQWENQIGNQKIPQDKEKCKHITTLRKCSKRSSKREVHSDTGLPWEIRKTSNKPSNSLVKRIRIRASIPPTKQQHQKKNPVSKGKEIIKVRGETNKIEIKK